MSKRNPGWTGLRARMGAVTIAVLGLGAPCLAAPPDDTIRTLSNWQGVAGPTPGYFKDVAIEGASRVYAGYVFDALNTTLVAHLFSTSGAPGGVISLTDLGFGIDPTVAVSIASQGGDRYWVAVSESDGVLETNAHVLDWSASSGVVETQLLGPSGGSAYVTVHGINRQGTAVGSVDGTTGLVAPAGSGSFAVSGPTPSEVFAISPDGDVLGGSADFGPGAVAAIWDASGTLVYADTAPGRIRDVASRFAVGTRNGIAAYWRLVRGSWIPSELREPGYGAPLAGELLGVDRDGLGVAGGARAGSSGGAIVAILRTEETFDLDAELGLPSGTLFAVNAVDVDPDTTAVAFAVEDEFLTGWDVTANFTTEPEPLPGPGAWILAPIGLMGFGVLRMSCVKL